LRSFIRGSRVSSPSRPSTPRNDSSPRASARPIASRSAPAWPESPPPITVASRLYLPIVFVTVNARSAVLTSVSRFRYSSGVRPFTVSLPAPAVSRTRAIASLRRPVLVGFVVSIVIVPS
jgi:hypothetical protein